MNPPRTDPETQNRHAQRMQRKKALIDAHINAADQDKGLLLVLMGNGKGKSSSGFGMVARALGHGLRVGIVQFIKGAFSTGEEHFFRRFPEVEYHVVGEGYTWETQDLTRDKATAARGWEIARRLLQDPTFDFILLDELNIVLKLGYLDLDEVLDDLSQRPRQQHVVITGRGNLPPLLELADTVTEMREVKHAYQAGIRAQRGIEL